MEGDVIGDAPRWLGGVTGVRTGVGELGEAGRRKGEDRGELKDDLYEDCIISVEAVSDSCHVRLPWSAIWLLGVREKQMLLLLQASCRAGEHFSDRVLVHCNLFLFLGLRRSSI